MVYIGQSLIECKVNLTLKDRFWSPYTIHTYPLDIPDVIRKSHPKFDLLTDLVVTDGAYDDPRFDEAWRIICLAVR